MSFFFSFFWIYENDPTYFPLNVHQPTDDLAVVRTALLTGEVNIVSDGSYQPTDGRKGAAAWVIETKDGSAQVIGHMSAVGPTSSQNACRSEMSGTLYAPLHLHSLCQPLTLHNIHLTIHCNGLSAISSINKAPQTSSCCAKSNFDIINSINALCPLLPFTFDLQHITGHQDSGTAYHRLTKLAQLNVQADSLAKHSISITDNQHCQSSLPFSPCNILIYTETNKCQKFVLMS